MPLLDFVGGAIKSFVSSAPDPQTPLSAYGGQGYGGFGVPGYTPGQTYGADYTLPNGQRAFGSAGIVGSNGVVAACGTALTEAFISAPYVMENLVRNQQARDGEPTHIWKRVESHPLTDLLNQPNNHYGGDHLWGATLASEVDNGNGYWRAVMTRDRSQVAELWFERGLWPEWDKDHFVTRYGQKVDGRPYWLEAAANGKVNRRTDYAIHFRYQINTENPRLGYTPVQTVYREILQDFMASNWQTGLLENGAGVGLFVSLLEGLDNSQQINIEEMQSFLDFIKAALRGRGAGGIAASSLPVKIDKISWSPEEMALDGIISRAESRICSVLGVDPMLISLAGTQRTFSNFAEAESQLQTRKIAPLQDKHGSQLEAQLFPLFELDRSQWRLVSDRSAVAAFQEDVNAKHTRVRADYQAGVSDLEEATAALGYKSTPEMHGLRFANASAIQVPAVEGAPPATAPAGGANTND